MAEKPTDEEILAGLAEIVEEVAGVEADEVTADKSFVDDLDIDSLSMVEIAVQAEDRFEVKIPDAELANLKTVGDAVTTSPRTPDTTEHPHTRITEEAMSTVEVVVTGMGATTPLGGDVTSTWDGLLAGRNGVRTNDAEWVERYDLPARLAAPLAVEPSEVLPRVQLRRLDRCEQVAIIAARQAWADAGYEVPTDEHEPVDPDRLGVAIGTGIGGPVTLLDQDDLLEEHGLRKVSPLTVPMLMPNGPAAHVSIELRARAGVHSPASACASGAEGLAQGYADDPVRPRGRGGRGRRGGVHPPDHGGRLRPVPHAVAAQRRAGPRVPAVRRRP